MKPKYRIYLPDHGLTDYDKRRFILYSERTGTEYRIDADEVIRMMDDHDVELSSKARAYIDRLLEPAVQV